MFHIFLHRYFPAGGTIRGQLSIESQLVRNCGVRYNFFYESNSRQLERTRQGTFDRSPYSLKQDSVTDPNGLKSGFVTYPLLNNFHIKKIYNCLNKGIYLAFCGKLKFIIKFFDSNKMKNQLKI
ncbi:hypothetical protein BpHYR1_012368 [Brachionus plicatilis]|uniref:Uncharacterized protein n=1 Tax=Brachionus plicatilis TaxID=10195 RepID=A0A3M7S1X9_BRAPC|nr:hypothetical protein BpHYR1_012368 [Brachionus plicatilis]